MRQIFVILVTFGFAGILAACGGAVSETPAITPAVTPEVIGDPDRGQVIYRDPNYTRCESCHSLDGSEHRGGPSLLGISEWAGERVAELSAVEYLRQSILEPSAHVIEGYKYEMKPYELVERAEGDYKKPLTLTEEELDDLIAYLLTQ